MKIYIFIGFLMIIYGLSVLITGNASWGAVELANLTGIDKYLVSLPELLLGLYILFYAFNKNRTD